MNQDVRPIALQPEIVPIYKRKMSPAAWQLLWWAIARMDAHCEIRGGWRQRAAREIGKDRYWIMDVTKQLVENGYITTGTQKRWMKVNVEQIQG